MASSLYAYRVKDTHQFKRHVGKYMRLCTRWDNTVSHSIIVDDVSDATIFRKGDFPKYKLPSRGKDYELVEVEVNIKEPTNGQGK